MSTTHAYMDSWQRKRLALDTSRAAFHAEFDSRDAVIADSTITEVVLSATMNGDDGWPFSGDALTIALHEQKTTTKQETP